MEAFAKAIKEQGLNVILSEAKPTILKFRNKIKCTFCTFESDLVSDFAHTREHTYIKKTDGGHVKDFDGRPTTTKAVIEEKIKTVIACCHDCFKKGMSVNSDGK